MKVTAVIPTKNRCADLVNTVNSIVRQSRLPDELVIIDQSDTDIARSAVQSILSGIDAIRLVYIYDPAIRGLVEAKSVGWLHASFELICFLEDDVLLEPSYILEMARGFQEYPKMLGACGVVINLPKLHPHYVKLFHLFHRGIFHDSRVGVHGHVDNMGAVLINSRYLSGGTSAYRRVVFEKVPFDLANNFFMLEDIDFSTRAAQTFGAEHFFINTTARLTHLMSPVNRSAYATRYQRKLTEYICFYKKNAHHKRALIHLTLLLAGLFMEATACCIQNKTLSPMLGASRGVINGIKWRLRSA